jgi:hypothetical protein
MILKGWRRRRPPLKGWSSLATSCYWRSLGRRDWTAWVRKRKKKKRILTTKEMPLHPLPLHHRPRCPLLSYQKRSTKRALWSQSQSRKI